MAVIYLTHPTHGAKVAISEEEAIFDESYGWERYTPETPAKVDSEDAGEPANALADHQRRGRPRAK